MKRLLALSFFLVLLLSACASAGPDYQPAQIETGVDAEAWVQIPAGEFLRGQHEHVTMVDYNYAIMITDVTNAQYAEYLSAALAEGVIKIVGDQVLGFYPGDEFHAHEHEIEIAAGDWLHVPMDDPGLRLTFDGKQFSPKAGYGNHPMVMVTWFGAQAYCQYYEGRLPSEVEWEKAARGSDGRPYPWGEGIANNQANFYSSHDIFEKISGVFSDTTPVGFYNGSTYEGYATLDGRSPFGLFDMAGNVWQWVGDVYPDQHYRYMRGGSKENYAYNLRIWTRNSASPDYYSPNVGFRCARDH